MVRRYTERVHRRPRKRKERVIHRARVRDKVFPENKQGYSYLAVICFPRWPDKTSPVDILKQVIELKTTIHCRFGLYKDYPNFRDTFRVWLRGESDLLTLRMTVGGYIKRVYARA